MGIRLSPPAPARASASGHLIPTNAGAESVVGRAVGDTLGDGVEGGGDAVVLDGSGVDVASGWEEPLQPATAKAETASSAGMARRVIVE